MKIFTPLFDFNAEIQNFVGYFYPTHPPHPNLNSNADFQKFSAEKPLFPLIYSPDSILNCLKIIKGGWYTWKILPLIWKLLL